MMTLADRIYIKMPDDEALDQTNRGKYNCAEAMLRAINDHYNLNLSQDAKAQMAAFGGGLFKGDVCGLLIGGYAGLAHMYGSDDAPKSNPTLRRAGQMWYDRFHAHFNTVTCRKMKPATGGCSGVAKQSAMIFEQLITEFQTT